MSLQRAQADWQHEAAAWWSGLSAWQRWRLRWAFFRLRAEAGHRVLQFARSPWRVREAMLAAIESDTARARVAAHLPAGLGRWALACRLAITWCVWRWPTHPGAVTLLRVYRRCARRCGPPGAPDLLSVADYRAIVIRAQAGWYPEATRALVVADSLARLDP